MSTRMLKKWFAAVICLIVAASAMLTLTASKAFAASLTPAPKGSYVKIVYDGAPITVGVTAVDEEGNLYYCIEADTLTDYQWGPVTAVDDSDEARQLAWLIDHYKNQLDDQTQGAIGVLVHDYFDRRASTTWQPYREVTMKTHPALEELSQRLWAEAETNAPIAATVERTYVQGLREGVLEANITNKRGQALAGVPYTAVLEGPAVFDNGEKTFKATSGERAQRHTWKATGQGAVKAYIRYDAESLAQMVSAQDFIRYDGAKQRVSDAVTFQTRKDFTPSVSTVVENGIVDPGEPVVDIVTSGATGENPWPQGMTYEATGWYFDGIDVPSGNISDHMVTPESGESASAFLKRLEQAGYRPSAYGSATFHGPGETVRVTAVTEQGGTTPYRSRSDGGIGTWVWAFDRAQQSEQAAEYLDTDVVTAFLEADETNVNRAKVQVESVVTEHSATIGSELSDTITVAGFPSDHGTFAGDDDLGIGADQPYAQVSVWWSGDPDDPANDEAYRPQGEAVPQEDEHHRLIGTWDYPAVNGRIRVGAGAPDAHGEPVSITAESHGWYVFVWNFAGDDRVMPGASAYDDAWERTRVEEFVKPVEPTLTTQVDPERVMVDEPFHDTARITGNVPKGAYVTFTAYEAIAEGDPPGLNAKLLDEVRVEVDHGSTDQTVSSPQTRSPLAGLVYWRATLFSEDGDVLATHELGAEGEVVTVEEPEEPEEPESEEAEEPEGPAMPITGSDMVPAAGAAVVMVIVGSAILAMTHRRKA